MPLTPEDIKEGLKVRGLSPEEFDVDPYTGEIRQRKRTQPTINPQTERKPEILKDAIGRNALLNVLPSTAALAPSLAAGSAITTASAPLAAINPLVPPALGLLGGLATGAAVSMPVGKLQEYILSKSDAGKEFMQKAAEAREAHPIAASKIGRAHV